MTILFIKNNHRWHNEIIESIIVNYNKILNLDRPISDIEIFLSICNDPNDFDVFSVQNFKQYIKLNYPYISFSTPEMFDYYISVSVYDRDYNTIEQNSKTKFYISHEITRRLSLLSNVFFLTHLVANYITADLLPYRQYKSISAIPIYIVQGNIEHCRRNFNLLKIILDQHYEYDFKIKLIGRGTLPLLLQQYESKIILKNNLNFMDYHKEFLDGYCILPLITKKTHPMYYTHKLTSTMNYASGYKLKCLIDKDLQDIYLLENVEVFNNETDIVDAFKRTLVDFYSNNYSYWLNSKIFESVKINGPYSNFY